MFTAGVIAVLSSYPINVQRIVADPRSAVLGRFREIWPFTERVRRACEDVHGPTRRIDEWNARTDAQLAEREAWEAQQARNPTAEEIRAKHGEHCGLDPSPDPALAPPDQAKRVETAQQRTVRMIEREYAAAGYAPVMAGDLIISPSLLKSIGKWPPVTA